MPTFNGSNDYNGFNGGRFNNMAKSVKLVNPNCLSIALSNKSGFISLYTPISMVFHLKDPFTTYGFLILRKLG
ncbi:hypothetical protein Lalb_Chr11g0071401 [Lupinus albus]|uniref:Uncharacterized protein n=1 Tax=Lupinus albus TaxID=3870 RepID=A0A6A4PSA6_LUPAL|nr:hypothetical protein Lalb_Chr11g0071401 [Lupinus albus]